MDDEALFHRSFTIGKTKRFNIFPVKKLRKDAAVLKNASWPSGVSELWHGKASLIETMDKRRILGPWAILRPDRPDPCPWRDTPLLQLVWGTIAHNTRLALVLIRCTITAQRYVHDILQPHVLPLMQRLRGAIFQQDNARPHTARESQDCLHTVTTLTCPARSPYLSPIEHIWDPSGLRV
ncbi:transposable element Tcb2 transposase [Trichonephila clavipes]|nr:transposable element Tcb2 transposase [Trichonephila clavipes]